MAIQQNQPIVIDPRFFVPPGLIDARQQNLDDSVYLPGDIALQDDAPILAPPTLATPTATIPMPPTSYQVVDQHVRQSPDGTAVVDVTLEFPDIPGVQTIEVRVTKTS